jgi:hypothetical protein
MGAPRKIEPLFELPPKLIEAALEYIGPTRSDRLTNDQKQALVGIANEAAVKIDHVLASDRTSET